MDLIFDQSALRQASADLQQRAADMTNLVNQFNQAVAALRPAWNSAAGRAFFQRFDTTMIRHIRDHALVFNHMSENLSTAANMYEEVIRAANTVANAQF